MKKTIKRILLILAALALAAYLGTIIYINDCYAADTAAVLALSSAEGISIRTEDNLTIFHPASPTTGFIFYPGGKVEHTAYAPLMRELAVSGILCVLVEMPGNLAVLNVSAAETIPQQFPEIDRWYIGGHSLGCSMAASYAADHSTELEGLVLLAAYSTADLRETGLKVLSVCGSEDGVLDLQKYEQYRMNLPEYTEEAVLAGANHAGFGSYGPQEGDGMATLSPQEQRSLTAGYIIAWINE